MKIQIYFVIFFVILIVFSSINTEAQDSESSEKQKYINFMNLFFPGSSDFTIYIFYKPGGTINMMSGTQKEIKVVVERINLTRHVDFYLRFIIDRGMWEPYNTPSTSSISFMEKLKLYNDWLNNTVPLTRNVYSLNPTLVHFKNSTINMTIPLKVKINGWGNDWGITILAREPNETLWIPVSGVPLNATNDEGMWIVLPYVYIGSISLILIAVTVKWRLRRKTISDNSK